MKTGDAQSDPRGDDEALLDAMRAAWPILSPTGRRQAVREAERTKRRISRK